jgi:hypothetical protein
MIEFNALQRVENPPFSRQKIYFYQGIVKDSSSLNCHALLGKARASRLESL